MTFRERHPPRVVRLRQICRERDSSGICLSAWPATASIGSGPSSLLGDPLFFGRGIGRRAIELAVQQLKETSAVERVTLNVRINNPRAIACYARCGFAIAATSDKRLDDESCVRFHTMIREPS